MPLPDDPQHQNIPRPRSAENRAKLGELASEGDLKLARESYFASGGIESDIGPRSESSWYWRRAALAWQERAESLGRKFNRLGDAWTVYSKHASAGTEIGKHANGCPARYNGETRVFATCSCGLAALLKELSNGMGLAPSERFTSDPPGAMRAVAGEPTVEQTDALHEALQGARFRDFEAGWRKREEFAGVPARGGVDEAFSKWVDRARGLLYPTPETILEDAAAKVEQDRCDEPGCTSVGCIYNDNDPLPAGWTRTVVSAPPAPPRVALRCPAHPLPPGGIVTMGGKQVSPPVSRVHDEVLMNAEQAKKVIAADLAKLDRNKVQIVNRDALLRDSWEPKMPDPVSDPSAYEDAVKSDMRELLTREQIECARRVGRDEVKRTTTIGLTEFDALCDTALAGAGRIEQLRAGPPPDGRTVGEHLRDLIEHKPLTDYLVERLNRLDEMERVQRISADDPPPRGVNLTVVQAGNVLRVLLHALRVEAKHCLLAPDTTAALLESATVSLMSCVKDRRDVHGNRPEDYRTPRDIACSACDGRGTITSVALSGGVSVCTRCKGSKMEPKDVEPIHAWDSFSTASGTLMRCGRERDEAMEARGGAPAWRIVQAGKPITRADGVTCEACLAAVEDPREDPLGILSRLRSKGWMVGVHNDYLQRDGYGNMMMTFWLFTHPASGVFVKGEGKTDGEALYNAEMAALAIHAITKAPGK